MEVMYCYYMATKEKKKEDRKKRMYETWPSRGNLSV